MSKPENLPVVPKFKNLEDANKAVEEMFWAIQYADAFLTSTYDTISAAKLSRLLVNDAFPYSESIIKTQRRRLHKALAVANAYATGGETE